MGFFSGYETARVGGVLAGLANLTVPGKSGASSEARRVVAAFARGENARGSCHGPTAARKCAVVSTGDSLVVNGEPLAKREAGNAVQVCVPSSATINTDKKGKQHEAQASKDVRATAGALLRMLKSGLGLKTDKQGLRRLVGSKHRSRVALPGTCLTVRVPPKEAKFVDDGFVATRRAAAKLDKDFPTRREISLQREEIHNENLKTRRIAIEAARAAAREAKAAEKVAKDVARKVTQAGEARIIAAQAAAAAGGGRPRVNPMAARKLAGRRAMAAATKASQEAKRRAAAAAVRVQSAAKAVKSSARARRSTRSGA